MSSDKCDLEFTSSKSLYTWLAVRKLGIFQGAVMGMLTVIGDKLAGPMDLATFRRLPSMRSIFWSGNTCWSGVTPMLLLSWSNGPGEGPSGNPRPWFCWGENRVWGIWFIACRRGNWDRASKMKYQKLLLQFYFPGPRNDVTDHLGWKTRWPNFTENFHF